MSMSTHVVGFKPADEKWKQMKAVYDACAAAEIEPPDEVNEFFEFEPPDPQGVKVELEEKDPSPPPKTIINAGGFKVPNPEFTTFTNTAKKKIGCVTEWRDDMREGFEVDVTKIPKDVTIIRFYNSY